MPPELVPPLVLVKPPVPATPPALVLPPEPVTPPELATPPVPTVPPVFAIPPVPGVPTEVAPPVPIPLAPPVPVSGAELASVGARRIPAELHVENSIPTLTAHKKGARTRPAPRRYSRSMRLFLRLRLAAGLFYINVGLGRISHIGADAEPGVGRLVVARLLKRHLCPVGRIVHECVDATGGHICRCVHA